MRLPQLITETDCKMSNSGRTKRNNQANPVTWRTSVTVKATKLASFGKVISTKKQFHRKRKKSNNSGTINISRMHQVQLIRFIFVLVGTSFPAFLLGKPENYLVNYQ